MDMEVYTWIYGGYDMIQYVETFEKYIISIENLTTIMIQMNIVDSTGTKIYCFIIFPCIL